MRQPADPVAGQAVSKEEIIGHGESLRYTFSQPGVYSVHADVQDDSGATGRASTSVIVGNDPPQVRFVSPASPAFFDPDQPILYELEIVDHEDGTNNYQLVEQDDRWGEIDPAAASRAHVQLIPVGTDGQPLSDATAPPGLKLIRQSGCLNCHATHRPLVGPAFVEVAKKYHGDDAALAQSIERVRQGSTGVWGKVPMLPHTHQSLEQLRLMVEHIYSIESQTDDLTARGLRNEIHPPPDAVSVRLEASYTDGGNGQVPALTGTASVWLRSPKNAG